MIRALIGTALLLLIINIGYVFASPVVKNMMLEGRMEELAKYSRLKSEHDIRREIMDFVDEKKIGMSSQELMVQKIPEGTFIAGQYQVHVTYWFHTHTYDFFPASDVEAKRQWELLRAHGAI